MSMKMLVVLSCLAFAACKPAPAVEAADSPALTKAKALVEQTARDFEALAAQAGPDVARPETANPEQLRALGERLRRGLESHRAEGEALNKQLTDDEKQRLRAFGQRRLVPAVRALEAKLGTAAANPAPPEPATPTAR